MRDRSGWRRVILCAISLCMLALPARGEPPVAVGERSFHSRIDLSAVEASLAERGHGQLLVVFPKFRPLSFLRLREVEILFDARIMEYRVAARAEREGHGPHRARLNVTSRVKISGPGIDKVIGVPDTFECPIDRSLSASRNCLIAAGSSPVVLQTALSPQETEGYTGTGRIAVEITLATQVSDESRNAAMASAVAGPVRLSGQLRIVYRYDLQGSREEALEKLASPGVRERLSPAEARRIRSSLLAGG